MLKSMTLPKDVKIVEVGPRDGLQNESVTLSSEIKLEFIHRLKSAGLNVIEATSFVSPKWIPQLSDHYEIISQLNPQADNNTRYPVLVPNLHGFQRAISAGAKEIAVFTAASETFCQKNLNCSIDESMQRIADILIQAKKNNLQCRGYISCVLGCPFEGKINPQKVDQLAKQLYDMGCQEISLGDTIGVGTALQAQSLVIQVARHVPIENIAVHFHDTYGQALSNIFACLQMGVNIIDSAIAGLGGCPIAPGASGNVATEDVVYLCHGLGINTGIDFQQLAKIGQWICEKLGHDNHSKAGVATLSKNK